MKFTMNNDLLYEILNLLPESLPTSVRWIFLRLFDLSNRYYSTSGMRLIASLPELSNLVKIEQRRLQTYLTAMIEAGLVERKFNTAAPNQVDLFEVNEIFLLRLKRIYSERLFSRASDNDTTLIKDLNTGFSSVLATHILSLHHTEWVQEKELSKPNKGHESALFVLLILVMHMGMYGFSNCSSASIKKYTGLRKSSVFKYLSELRKKQIIRCSIQGIEKQRGLNDYGSIHFINLSHPLWGANSKFTAFLITPYSGPQHCLAYVLLLQAIRGDIASDLNPINILQQMVSNCDLPSGIDSKLRQQIGLIRSKWHSNWSATNKQLVSLSLQLEAQAIQIFEKIMRLGDSLQRLIRQDADHVLKLDLVVQNYMESQNWTNNPAIVECLKTLVWLLAIQSKSSYAYNHMTVNQEKRPFLLPQARILRHASVMASAHPLLTKERLTKDIFYKMTYDAQTCKHIPVLIESLSTVQLELCGLLMTQSNESNEQQLVI